MEQVVLVDESDSEIGTADRLTAHREGRLHRAVSVFVLNERGETLLQRRAPTKSLFAGRWANACCTHPRPGEGVVAAGERRLSEEMGLDVSLHRLGTFIYRARDPDTGLAEHELDHVLVGSSETDPILDPDEADSYAWADLEELRLVASSDEKYAPWLGEALSAFPVIGQIE